MPQEITTGQCSIAGHRRAQEAKLCARLRSLRGPELAAVRQIYEQPKLGVTGQLYHALQVATLLERIEQQLAELPADDPGQAILKELHSFYEGENP